MFKISFLTLQLLFASFIFAQTTISKMPEDMVLIPGGTFLMGTNEHQRIASPKHPVTLSPFYMDIYEVTNHQYYEFCMAKGHKFPEFWKMSIYKSGLDYPDHPVVGVSHFDATQYAEWAGKRLPTEAEWEYAGRGGLDDISFYFGEEADHSYARYNNPKAEKGPVKTGSYSPNGYGLYDMAGNAWEWVGDWFNEEYYNETPEENPAGPGRGIFKVFRGGGWHSGPGCISVHWRNALPQHWVDIAGGFRCVKELGKSNQENREK